MNTTLVYVAAAVVFSTFTGCAVATGDTGAEFEEISFEESAITAVSSQTVLARAEGIAPHNRPYVFNGIQDCYGYVRQVWNAILKDGSKHSEDFYPNSYNKSRWLGVSGGLPVADYPSSNWVYFSDPNVLLPGDVLATHQGHAWGDSWHGGIYAGKSGGQHRQWDNTTYNGNGAYNRPLYSGFHYYYRPTHQMLAASTSSGSSSSGSSSSTGSSSSPQFTTEYATFVPYFPINVRSGPSTSSSVVGTYSAGQSVRYDSYWSDGRYVWIHYISYSGNNRYMVVRENGTAWGDFY